MVVELRCRRSMMMTNVPSGAFASFGSRARHVGLSSKTHREAKPTSLELPQHRHPAHDAISDLGRSKGWFREGRLSEAMRLF
jgi:hypothetical protein